MSDDAYLQGYRDGFEDGQLPYLYWTRGPFVIVYSKDEGWSWSWRNVVMSGDAQAMLDGMQDAAAALKEEMDDSRDD